MNIELCVLTKHGHHQVYLDCTEPSEAGALSLSKLYLKIQSIPQIKHNTLPLQRSAD
jgi:hypothetical protein